jgi:hypothetical protein
LGLELITQRSIVGTGLNDVDVQLFERLLAQVEGCEKARLATSDGPRDEDAAEI